MKVDLLLKDACLYNVYLKKWLPRDVAVLADKIFYVGDSSDKGFKPEMSIDCQGRPLIPGMIDIHLHIESSYCTPYNFSKAVLKRGITTVVSEPHEMANIFGKAGIEEMIRLSANCGADIFYGVPSSVPSTHPGLETTGGVISPEDGAWLFDRYPEIICVGEIMTYSSLIKGDVSKTRAFLKAVRQRNVLPAVEGHCPGISGLDLARVLYEGVNSDHCLQDPESMLQRFEQGMFVELQYKSLTEENLELLKTGEYTGLYSFVTDDIAPDILVRQGHLDGVVRKALSLGLPLEEAVMAGTHAPAVRMGFRDRGALSPGMIADMILLKDRGRDFEMLNVFKSGREVHKGNESSGTLFFQDKFKKSIHINQECLGDDMFRLEAPDSRSRIRVRSIIKNETDTYTREGSRTLEVVDGLLDWERSDCNLLLVIDRYSGEAAYGRALLEGCYFRGGAVATSHVHDSHNLLVSGDNSEDMKLARDWIIQNQGGICVCSEGRIAAAIDLPIGGILSELPLEELSEKMVEISDAMRDLGFHHNNPLMSFSTLPLVVSPEIKLSDKGIVRTDSGEILSLFL